VIDGGPDCSSQTELKFGAASSVLRTELKFGAASSVLRTELKFGAASWCCVIRVT
jgi:hypothetical protein